MKYEPDRHGSTSTTHADHKAIEDRRESLHESLHTAILIAPEGPERVNSLTDEYKALEDERNSLRSELATANEQHWKTLQELAECRRDAEIAKWMLKNAGWARDDRHSIMEIRLPYETNLESYGMRYDAVTKAIARSKA